MGGRSVQRAGYLFVIAIILATLLPAARLHALEAPAGAAEISVGDATLWEGDVKNRRLVFPVTLSEPATETITVDYTLTGLEATGGSNRTPGADFNDRRGVPKTLTFKPGKVQRNLSVPVYGDIDTEGDETMQVNLSSPTGGSSLHRAVGTGTILDDDVDDAVRLTIGDVTVVEGDTSARPVRFSLNLSRSAAGAVSVDYRVVPVTVTGGHGKGQPPPEVDVRDDASAWRSVTFKPSARTGLTSVQKQIVVTTFADDEAEGDETFEIELANLTGPAVLADATGVGTIIDDDALAPGSLWAWGAQTEYGLVGNGGETDLHVPTQIDAAHDWVDVDAASAHTIALRADGTMWAWGSNSDGQLGDGTTEDRTTPTPVSGGGGWTAIVAGIDHSAALRSDGTLWTWGDNEKGQLGDGTTDDSLVPKQIGADSDWVVVEAGAEFTLALKTDGTLWGWGYNDNGALGVGPPAHYLVPSQVGADDGWATVSAGFGHAVALRSDGTLWTWGQNESGQLGDGSLFPAWFPEQVGTDDDWAAASAGYAHTVARKVDGGVWTWGWNMHGQLGDGTTSDRSVPAQVSPPTTWRSVVAGGATNFAVAEDGTLWAWGYNNLGTLGDATTVNRKTPTQIGTDTGWDDATLAPGFLHTVAVRR
jgi:alpha-tubulin suppressor-like RCC1 family protein